MQALSIDTSASSDPNFNNNTFEEKFNNGWLRNYYYGVIIFLVANVVNALRNLRYGIYYMGNPISGYNTFFYGLGLIAAAAAALLLALGLFLQYQAIRLRSLEKQEACVRIATLFILAQICAGGACVFFALLSSYISLVSALTTNVVFLAVGVGFRFLSSNVKNIMLGKAEESFKFDKSAFQA